MRTATRKTPPLPPPPPPPLGASPCAGSLPVTHARVARVGACGRPHRGGALRQVFADGFFNADPHPGNILVTLDRETNQVHRPPHNPAGPDRMQAVPLHMTSDRPVRLGLLRSNHEQRVLLVSCYMLQVVCYMLQVVCYMLQVAWCILHAG